MPITLPPEAPQTSDPINFADEADAWVAYWSVASAELNVMEANFNAQEANIVALVAGVQASQTIIDAATAAALSQGEFFATSDTNISFDAGIKTIILKQPDKEFVFDDLITLVRRTNPEMRLTGQVTAVSGVGGTTIEFDVPADGIYPEADGEDYGDWLVILSAFADAGGDVEDLLAAITSQVSVTPALIREGMTFRTLLDGPTVTPDGNSSRNYNWTIAGNRALAAITNTYPGATFLLKITQDATGSRILAWASGVYKRVGGVPILSTAAGAVDFLQLKVIMVNGANTATLVLATFLRAPSS